MKRPAGAGRSGALQRADAALQAWWEERVQRGTATEEMNWDDYEALVAAYLAGLGARPGGGSFLYQHRVELQDSDIGVGMEYSVRTAYTDAGGDGEPLVAIGGITNVAHRFDFLAMDAAPEVRVIGLDLAGRGRSGWLAELSDYHLETYIAQLEQLLAHLGLETCSLLGSSLGGSIAICFAARYPERVRRLVLNDSGPYIPVARRARRAVAVARHYVFRSPSEMFRRTGAASRNAGPASDAALLHSAHHKTRWSEADGGRVYRHDLRALLAYRLEAERSLDLWEEWGRVRCPVLLVHGSLSDATPMETIERMRGHDEFSVIHVPGAGHTPSMSDARLIRDVAEWVVVPKRFEADRVREVVNGPRVLYGRER